MTYQRKIGDTGETMAQEFLIAKGYQILDRNYTSRFGELDLIALDGEDLVFVEVKTRTSDAFGLPEESITPAKLARIHKTALMWLQAHPEVRDDWRIEVVAIILDAQRQITDIQHFGGDPDA